MIHFTLPNYIDNPSINNALTLLCYDHPEYFLYKNMKLSYTDTTFPYFFWSASNYNNHPSEMIPERADLAALLNRSSRLVVDCANPLLVATDYLDVRLNAFLEELENGSNALLISTPEMLAYVTSQYGSYRLIGSDIYYKYDPQKQYLDQLSFIRQSPLNIGHEYYNDIPKSKIEMCIASLCGQCANYEKCVEGDCKNRLLFSEKSEFRVCTNTIVRYSLPHEIQNLINQGYTHFYYDFKGVIPGDFDTIIDIYLHTLVKEEYHDIVAQVLYKGVRNEPKN